MSELFHQPSACCAGALFGLGLDRQVAVEANLPQVTFVVAS